VSDHAAAGAVKAAPATASRRRGASLSRQFAAWAFLLPITAYLAVFYAYPLYRNVDLSLREYTVRSFVQGGAKFVGPNTVTYIRASDSSDARFGFIVAKSVGIAVVRNRVRRRLKAASYSLLPHLAPGYDVVVRALPEAGSQPYRVLFEELSRSLSKGSVLA